MTPPETLRARHAMAARRFEGSQRVHFMLGVVLPTGLALLMPVFLPVLRERWLIGIAIWAVCWTLVGGFGVSVGLHRLFAHRSFVATAACRRVLAVLGCMAVQGPVTYWVSLHRMHHALSDRPGDPHSPLPVAWGAGSGWQAFLRGHMGWAWRHDVPMPHRYARELQADPVVQAVDRHYHAWTLMSLVLPAAAGALALRSLEGGLVGFYWGGVLRIALGHQVIWAINSWCHCHGSRSHEVADNSRNVLTLALVSFGESWHNNHHGSPTSARFGKGWREPDLGHALIRLLQGLGLAMPKADDSVKTS